jgi:hypothetical protein
MLDELIQAVARNANLAPEQAALVVAVVLRFFSARLPSALVGELQFRLGRMEVAQVPASAPNADPA